MPACVVAYGWWPTHCRVHPVPLWDLIHQWDQQYIHGLPAALLLPLLLLLFQLRPFLWPLLLFLWPFLLPL